MNKDEQEPLKDNVSASLNCSHQQKKMKMESEGDSTIIAKPAQNAKDKVSFIYPSISVETISDVLDKAEQNIHQGIQLLRTINEEPPAKENIEEVSSLKGKRRKRDYIASSQTDKAFSLDEKNSQGKPEVCSLKTQGINQCTNPRPFSENYKEKTPESQTSSREPLPSTNETEMEAQRMVDEIEAITSKEGLRAYLLTKFPTLLSDKQESSPESISSLQQKADNLEQELKQIINTNQQLTQEIALRYTEYDELKKDNDKNIPLLCKAIAKFEGCIDILENDLDEKKLETTKLREQLKIESQAEMVLSVEATREGY